MAARKALSKKVRFEVFKRDGFECQYCGCPPSKAPLQVDHIHPVKEGGTNEIDNLVTSCQPCNLGKGATLLSMVPQSLKDKAKATKEHEAQIEAYSKVMTAKRERIHADAWLVGDIYIESLGEESILKSKLVSIKKFNKELGVHEVMDAMEQAIARGIRGKSALFRYFCAICWARIKEQNNA
jgi:hypothetical protein